MHLFKMFQVFLLIIYLFAFQNTLFGNNYRLTGSCENSIEVQFTLQFPLMVTFYITVAQYQNQEINTGTA